MIRRPGQKINYRPTNITSDPTPGAISSLNLGGEKTAAPLFTNFRKNNKGGSPTNIWKPCRIILVGFLFCQKVSGYKMAVKPVVERFLEGVNGKMK